MPLAPTASDIDRADIDDRSPRHRPVVMLPGCSSWPAAPSAAGVLPGRPHGRRLPLWLLAAEVLATILGLFLFGSFKYQIHKNALTYGMLLVIVATFCGLPTSAWHAEIAEHGLVALDRDSTCCRSTGSTI